MRPRPEKLRDNTFSPLFDTTFSVPYDTGGFSDSKRGLC